MEAKDRINLKYKICLLKAYFEKGWGLTNYIKYLIAFFGLASQDLRTTMIFGIIYFFMCFGLGYFWFKVHLYDQEIEVSNKFNPFVREMRDDIKNRKT